jgi:hypothetical protein
MAISNHHFMRKILFILFPALVLFSCNTNAAEDQKKREQQDTLNVSNLLLKDYRPKSRYKNNETFIENAKYPVIDLHAHPYAKTSGELEEWVGCMKKWMPQMMAL